MATSVSVIASFYNNADLFRRALWGYAAQDSADFTIVVADDGSSRDQVDAVAGIARDLGLNLSHLWHEDNGFRKARILNAAIARSRSDLLIFVDADMIPRRDFISNHLALSRPGFFLSGGAHLNLPEDMQDHIDPSVVEAGRLFEWNWLRQYVDVSQEKRFRFRLGKSGTRARLMDFLFPRSNAFIGCNSSCWRADALAINGFDEDWGYGGTDREFGIRLTNNGVKSRRHQFSLVALHQEHGRGYRDPDKVRRNKQMLKERASSGITRIDHGIDRHEGREAEVLYTVGETHPPRDVQQTP